MEWDIYKSKNHSAYTGTAESGDSDEFLKKSFHELWDKFIHTVMPLNDEVNWNFIRIEFWADSGRIIIFPASFDSRRRIEKASCQIILPGLLNFWEELADSDISDEEFDLVVTKRQAEYAQLLETTAVSLSIGKALKGAPAELQFWSAEEDEPFKKSLVE